jgi:hypothetical protein
MQTLEHFLILAPPPPSKENGLKAKVRAILEGKPDRIYRDGIETIDRVEIIDGAIEGEFSDSVGVRAVKRVGFRITPKSVDTWILNPDEVATFSAYQGAVLAMFAPMFGKGSRAKPKKCVKGLKCGNGCLRRLQVNGEPTVCRKVPSPELRKKIEEAIATAKPAYTVVELARRRDEIKAIAGEAAVEAAEANMKELFAKADLYIRCSPETIDKILESGRLKSQFETMSSGGTLDTATREKVEKAVMGYSTNTAPENRPIYGYFADAGKHSDTAAEYYGSVVIKLRPEARNRATFTAEDSLASELMASSAKAPSLGAIKTKAFNMKTLEMEPMSKEAIADTVSKIGKAKSMSDLRAAMGTLTYTEAQVHGQVKVSDIAEIIYTESLASEFAKSSGIKISAK